MKTGEGDHGTKGRPHPSCSGPVQAAGEVTQTVSEEDKEGQTQGGGEREGGGKREGGGEAGSMRPTVRKEEEQRNESRRRR